MLHLSLCRRFEMEGHSAPAGGDRVTAQRAINPVKTTSLTNINGLLRRFFA